MKQSVVVQSKVSTDDASDDAVNAIVARGPGGAFAVAGIATLIVVVIYLAFYFLAYLPRGIVR